MTVTAIPTKFRQGLRDKDTPNARVAVESGLQTASVGSKYVSIPLNSDFNQDGEFSICWTMDQVTLNDPFSTVYGNRLAALDFIVVQLLAVSATEFSIRMTYNGTSATVNHVINVPIQYLTQKTDFVLLCETDVSTGGVNETSLYANGRLIGSAASGNSGSVLSDGSDASIGSNAGAATTFLDGTLSHVALLDRHLTQREITYKWANGGVFPESSHANILAHWVLTHRYAPLTAPNRVVDVVNIYNYAKSLLSIPDISTWVADLGFTQLGNAIRYDGTAGGSRSQTETIVNLGGGDIGRRVVVHFEVTNLVGAGGFYILVGTNTPTVVHQYITAVGLYTVELRYDAGGTTLSFTNVDPATGVPSVDDRTTDYTFTDVVIEDGIPNHGELIGYTDAEVGAINPMNQDAFKDFYNKTILTPKGLVFDGSTNYGLLQNAAGVSINTDHTFIITVAPDGNGDYGPVANGLHDLLWSGVSGSTLWLLRLQRGGGTAAALKPVFVVADGGNQTKSFDFQWAEQAVAVGAGADSWAPSFTIVVRYTAGTNTFDFWAAGLREATPLVASPDGANLDAATAIGARQGTFATKLQNVGIVSMQWLSEAISDKDALAVSRNGGFVESNNIEFQHSFNAIPTSVAVAPDLSGNSRDVNLTAFSAASPIIEAHSLLPEPRLGLQLDGSLTQKLELPNFVGSIPDRAANGAGWTFIMGFALNENRNFVQFIDWLWGKRDLVTANEIIGVFGSSGSTKSLNILHQNNASGSRQDFQTTDLQNWNTDGISIVSYRLRPDNYSADPLAWTGEWYLNGVLINSHQSSQQDPPDFADVTGSFFLWGERFASRTLANASVFFSAIWQRALSPKEIIRITNNGIIRNPSVEMQDRLELYVDYNAPFDNGGTPEFRDLSPNNHQIIANGFANLAAVQAAQVNINSLR